MSEESARQQRREYWEELDVVRSQDRYVIARRFSSDGCTPDTFSVYGNEVDELIGLLKEAKDD